MWSKYQGLGTADGHPVYHVPGSAGINYPGAVHDPRHEICTLYVSISGL